MPQVNVQNARNRRGPRQPVSHPAVDRPEWYDLAANAHGNQRQALAIPTREVKLRIDILAAWLNNPVEARKLSRDERIEMQVRLEAFRLELRRRNELSKARAAEQRSRMH